MTDAEWDALVARGFVACRPPDVAAWRRSARARARAARVRVRTFRATVDPAVASALLIPQGEPAPDADAMRAWQGELDRSIPVPVPGQGSLL